MGRRDLLKTGALLPGANSLLRPQMWADVPTIFGRAILWHSSSSQPARPGAFWHWPGTRLVHNLRNPAFSRSQPKFWRWA